MSIDWEKTAKYYNKSINEIKEYFKKYSKSHKKVYAICDKCRYERLIPYYRYQKTKGLCNNCSIKKGKNHPNYKNNVGKEYNGIKILKEIGKNKYGLKIVLAQCHCGNKFKVLEAFLKNGNTKSCGCLTSKLISEKISGEKSPHWKGGISFGKYCPKFNNKIKKKIREKYNNCDYISGLHKNICNNGQNLHVHHIDYDKEQGCNEKKWQLIPLSCSNHIKTNFNREFWNKLFIYALEYDKEYYNEEKINLLKIKGEL